MTLDTLRIDVKAGRSITSDSSATDVQRGQTRLGTVEAKTLDVVIAGLTHPLERRQTLKDIRRVLGKKGYAQLVSEGMPKRVSFRSDIKASEVNMMVYGLRQTEDGYITDSSLVFTDNRGETEAFRKEREFRREDLEIIPEYINAMNRISVENMARKPILDNKIGFIKYTAIVSALGIAATLGAVLIDRCTREAKADESAPQAAQVQERPIYAPPLSIGECLDMGLLTPQKCDEANAVVIQWIYDNREKICKDPSSFEDIINAAREGRLNDLVGTPYTPQKQETPKLAAPQKPKKCYSRDVPDSLATFMRSYVTGYDKARGEYVTALGEGHMNLLADDEMDGTIDSRVVVKNGKVQGLIKLRYKNIDPSELNEFKRNLYDQRFPDAKDCSYELKVSLNPKAPQYHRKAGKR